MIRLIIFALVGIANTMIDFAIFLTLLSLSPLPVSTCNIVSYLVGIGSSYLLNRNLTFRDRPSRRVAGAILYVSTCLVGLALNTSIVVGLIPLVGAFAAKACATMVTFAVNYALSNLVVFVEPGHRARPVAVRQSATDPTEPTAPPLRADR